MQVAFRDGVDEGGCLDGGRRIGCELKQRRDDQFLVPRRDFVGGNRTIEGLNLTEVFNSGHPTCDTG
jgi:hypothetical protein